MKKWKWEKWDLFILLIRMDGEGNSRLGSRRTSRRGVRRNLQRERCRMILRWICCWAKDIKEGHYCLASNKAYKTNHTRIGGWGRRTTWGCKLWRSWNSRRFWEVSEERLRNDWNIAKVELRAFVKISVFGKDNLLQNFVKTVSSSHLSWAYCLQHHLLDLQHNRQL